MGTGLEFYKQTWRAKAPQRGYSFGFNLKGLVPDAESLGRWHYKASRIEVNNRTGLKVAVYVPPIHAMYVSKDFVRMDLDGRKVPVMALGIQEIHWAEPGSHTGATPAYSVLKDAPNFNSVLINHSEVIAEHGRTLSQAASQLRMALDATVEGRAFKFITLCVGETREVYDEGRPESMLYVRTQIEEILNGAKVQEVEMSKIGIAYEPRFAIQVGDKPGIPPEDDHIRDMGWAILEQAANSVSWKGMASMFALQYGGSMKGPDDKVAPVQRFVGPGNLVDDLLYNGGLIGTAGKDPETAAAIINRIVPISDYRI